MNANPQGVCARAGCDLAVRQWISVRPYLGEVRIVCPPAETELRAEAAIGIVLDGSSEKPGELRLGLCEYHAEEAQPHDLVGLGVRLFRGHRSLISLMSIGELAEEFDCRACGCTEEHACAGGCYWVEADLCSRCASRDVLRPVSARSRRRFKNRLGLAPDSVAAARVDISRIWLE